MKHYSYQVVCEALGVTSSSRGCEGLSRCLRESHRAGIRALEDSIRVATMTLATACTAVVWDPVSYAIFVIPVVTVGDGGPSLIIRARIRETTHRTLGCTGRGTRGGVGREGGSAPVVSGPVATTAVSRIVSLRLRFLLASDVDPDVDPDTVLTTKDIFFP